MERELTRRCRRSVRVAEFVAADSVCSINTGSKEAVNAGRETPLFAGYVEALYARNAWLAARVDIWASRDTCYRQVKSSSVHLQQNEEQVAVQVANGSELTALQKVEELGLSVADRGEPLALTGDELTKVLKDVVKQLVDAFQAVQVQSLQAAPSQRAKFEHEMLQHHPGLEVLVLTSESTGSYVLFALPLLGEKPQWDPKGFVEKEDLDSVYIPDGFHAPNFLVTTDVLTIFIGYPMEEEGAESDGAWPLVVEWPANMLLSSQVTQTPPSSKAQSSVELIASCKKMFLQQWRARKDFIAELRHYAIVLEYDAVDFSQVFFMLQEQLNERAPLRIIVLRLQFTAAFFLTNCMSDLQVTLLDGEGGAAPVTVALSPSSAPPVADSQACVAQFLESSRKSLLRHFYGD
ncbi:hypothetical protein PHYPSEUDO_004928 [Phytophthora pseudosyringae]|uniref:Uncharacterized protein n=1 Tax=Phytophthora pseudosyringae TaxID=221518 RepID=A0A8T1WHF4_9STRA|nr:hypothetical protein PHYPSEUDO_004928 [Phytophthora pseudosyringae]